MITNVRDWVDLLVKMKISPNQFLICWLVHDKDVQYTIKYFEENKGNRFSREDIDYLVEREYLLRLSKDKMNYQLDYFVTTAKFTENLLVDSEDAGEELWNLFPNWLKIQGVKTSAKSCDKDELIGKYARKIKGSFKKHKKVMEIVTEYVKRNDGYATMGIEKFVNSEQWTVLEDEYNENPETGDLTVSM